MHTSLDHEKLEVYQASLEFITWTIPFLERLPGTASVRNQLDRASTSVPLNIAEGNGKFTSPDRCRFFDNARGSALESAACLDVMVAKRFVGTDEIQRGKAMLVRIVSMLFGLIRANSDTRVFEEPTRYCVGIDQKNKSRSKSTNKSRKQNRINSPSTTG
jgi:four helix bundle protein